MYIAIRQGAGSLAHKTFRTQGEASDYLFGTKSNPDAPCIGVRINAPTAVARLDGGTVRVMPFQNRTDAELMIKREFDSRLLRVAEAAKENAGTSYGNQMRENIMNSNNMDSYAYLFDQFGDMVVWRLIMADGSTDGPAPTIFTHSVTERDE